MALDAATLALTAAELARELAEARIDKIYQPTRDEVIFSMRNRQASFRLLLSARSGSARICITRETYENPATPPSYCMLLRKHLIGGRLLSVRTLAGERIAFFDFLCTNEMGDQVVNTFAAELMGRYCNLVLVFQGQWDEVKNTEIPMEGGRITDALKRVDFEDSEVRQLLPGLGYTLPPEQNRIDFISTKPEEIWNALVLLEMPLEDALRKTLGGIGPVVIREIFHRGLAGYQGYAADLSADKKEKLLQTMREIQADYMKGGTPLLVRKPDGVPVEFSFTELTQYQPAYSLEKFANFSAMLEDYYARKDKAERLRQKSKELRKTVQNMYDRAVRKQAARKEELAQSEQSDHLRIAGELLTANLHSIEKGASKVTLANWYDGSDMEIKLDVRLLPSANAQKYFKEYKKKQTAVRMLTELLETGAKEIVYLETVLYEIDSAEGEVALGEIRAELKSQGYLKHYKQKDKKQKPADFLRYRSEDGFLILVGRNNLQNEKLTLKVARGKDMWFHLKNAPGSHVVVMSEGQDIPLATQNQAAQLAAYYSSQEKGVKIPIDYTEVKNIRKTGDLPPGMVLYDHYETAYITPDETEIKKIEKIEKQT